MQNAPGSPYRGAMPELHTASKPRSAVAFFVPQKLKAVALIRNQSWGGLWPDGGSCYKYVLVVI
jgi:hypothetical protein